MNILYHFTIEHLKKNRKRTITTIIGVIISAALICGSSLLAASFQDMFLREAIENNGNYHGVFIDVPSDHAKYIIQNENVKESMISKNIGYAKIDSQNEYKPYVFIKAYDETSMKEQPIHLLEGRFPENSNEILLPEHVTSNGNVKVKVGDELVLDIGSRYMGENILSQGDSFDPMEVFKSNKTQQYVITGIIQRPDFEQYSAPGYTAITYLNKDNLSKGDVINVSVLLKNPSKIYDIAPQIAQKAGLEMSENQLGEMTYNISYNSDLLRWLGISNDQMFVTSFYYILFIIIPLIALGSISVIYNSFTISVSERKKQFGMLISVGATPRQIKKTIIFEAIIIALIGIPIGIISGIAGIKITLVFANGLMSQINDGIHQIQMVTTPLVILLTVFFSSLIIFISAYLPSRKASKISPVEAIRANDELSSSNIKVSTGWMTKKIFGIEGEIALKTLKRNKRKYRTTIFSIFISVVMFISVSSFMKYTIMGSETYSTEYNFAVFLHDSPDNQEMINYLSQIPDTQKISTVKSVPGDIIVKKSNLTKDALNKFSNKFMLENGNVRVPASIYSVGEKSFLEYIDTLHLDNGDFTNKQDIHGILVNHTTSYWDDDGKVNKAELDVLNVKSGDNIRFYQSHDLANEASKELKSLNAKIVSVTDEKPFGLDNVQGPVFIVKEDDYLNAANILYKDNMEYIENNINVYINSDNTDNLEEMYLAKAKSLGMVMPSYFNQEKSDRSTMMTIRLIQLFFYGFIALITLIGVTNILNTIATNIQLRNREFAILQSTGLTPGGLNKILFLESAFYGIKALSYGLPISIGISYMLYKNVNNGIMNYISYSLPWGAMGICIISVFVIVYTTMMYASSKTKKTSIIDVIRNENI